MTASPDRVLLGHDDRLDALAMAVAFWVDSMAKGTEQAIDEMREEALRQFSTTSWLPASGRATVDNRGLGSPATQPSQPSGKTEGPPL